MTGSGGAAVTHAATLPSFAFAGFRATFVPATIRLRGHITSME